MGNFLYIGVIFMHAMYKFKIWIQGFCDNIEIYIQNYWHNYTKSIYYYKVVVS